MCHVNPFGRNRVDAHENRQSGPGDFLAQMVEGSVSVTASPQPCAVGTDAAAFLSFVSGATVGYMVLLVPFR